MRARAYQLVTPQHSCGSRGLSPDEICELGIPGSGILGFHKNHSIPMRSLQFVLGSGLGSCSVIQLQGRLCCGPEDGSPSRVCDPQQSAGKEVPMWGSWVYS